MRKLRILVDVDDGLHYLEGGSYFKVLIDAEARLSCT